MLAKRIRALREENGMRQEDLAQLLRVTSSAVGMYEQGRRVPGLDTLVAMSAFFGVSLDYLVMGTLPPAPQRTPETCPCNSCYWKPNTP